MFRKLPTAWLQLRHQKVRLIVALSGVIFAVVIVFMQLGIRDALFNSSVRFHEGLQGDCFLISPRSTSLIAMQSFPERRLLQSLAFDEVEFVSPIYLGFAQWKNPETKNSWRNIFIIGIDLRHQPVDYSGFFEFSDQLKITDQVLFDQDSRSEFGPIASDFKQGKVIQSELGNQDSNRQVKVVGLFKLGTSFGSDGNIITSHLNFLRIFNNRHKGFID
ncbi:ABC transporter permease, partial [Moorena sp. SIO3I6]|uniref:ABC transporter permease n=1 Tax=Moorena sp. SIO3I6 TaxID=2607831 RepID=UPI0013F89439|nr:ABC transporter [Moorena sp. SIO3I6]